MDSLFGMITSGLIGVGLAASCGFRVFVPMLVMSVAIRAEMLEVTDGWSWIGSWPALCAFSCASVTEICAFYVPWVANLLDAVATPSAVVAGTIATAACVSEMHPLLQWSAAIIAGGGIAATVQFTTVGARLTSTATTGGLADWVVATFELLMSLVMAVLAVLLPILAGVLVLSILVFVIRTLLLRRRRRKALPADTPALDG
jgi:hypothetical protein